MQYQENSSANVELENTYKRNILENLTEGNDWFTHLCANARLCLSYATTSLLCTHCVLENREKEVVNHEHRFKNI